MKKKLVVASIIITIYATGLLYQEIYNFDSFLNFYLRCLDDKASGELPSYYSCSYQFTDFQYTLMPIALFGMAIWMGYWGFRDSLSRTLQVRIIIPILVAAIASVLTLALKGVMMFSSYLDCIKQCPTGTCGGATGTDPIWNCTLPVIEFVLPLVIIGIVSGIIAVYARKRTKEMHYTY